MENKKDIVIDCMMLILRPLARICLRHSIKLADVVELVKIVFVQVAREELERTGKEVSLSKISAMTGVHRKDATRIDRSAGAFKPADNLISKVMVQWQHDQRFVTKSGKPRSLSAEGKQSEFAALVSAVNGGDISPYAVLHEMERMGVLERKGKRVSLAWKNFVIQEDEEVGLRMLAEDSRDLTLAVDQNLLFTNKSPNLHLKTEFDRVVDSKIPQIREWLLDQGSEFHRKARKYIAQFDADVNPKLRGMASSRVALGTFSITED